MFYTTLLAGHFRGKDESDCKAGRMIQDVIQLCPFPVEHGMKRSDGCVDVLALLSSAKLKYTEGPKASLIVEIRADCAKLGSQHVG